MKKMRRIIVICFAVVLTMIAASGAAHASVVYENNTGISIRQNLGAGSDGKTWMNPHYKTVPQYLFTIKTGGEQKYGYCFQTGKIFSNGYAYTAKKPANSSAWTNLSASRQRIIRLVLFYGYNNGKSAPVSGANTNDYYAATQVLVWEAADGDITLSADGKWSKSTNRHYKLISGRTNAVRCYEWIKSEISKHVKGPSFAAKSASGAITYTMKYDYETGQWKTYLDDTAKGNYYKLASVTDSGLGLARDGYLYTFNAKQTGRYTGILMNNKSDGTSQEMMVFKPSHSGKQAIVIGATDTAYFYVNFKTEGTGTGIIKKTTSDGSSPEGFSFLLENKENGYSKIHTTDKNGKIKAVLYPGTYAVTEILTDEQKEKGFVYPAGGKLEIREGEEYSLELKNERKMIPYKIQKTSDNGVIEGFEFVFYSSDGMEAARGVTDAAGTISGQLYPGKYTVKEVLTEEQIKEGFRASDTQYIEITSDMSAVQTIRCHNLWDPIEGKIAIRKITDDGGPPGGFRFNIKGILASTGEEYVQNNCITDETGQFITEEVQPGTYTITEVLTEKQAERYEMPESKIVKITEAEQGTIVNFENEAIRTEVKVHKTSEDGNVQGVKFNITGTYLWGGEFPEISKETDENGVFTVRLQPGTYTITEDKTASEGYKPQPPKTITVTGKEAPINVNLINIPNTITLSKTETLENGMAANTPVQGAVYEVFRYGEYNGEKVKIDYGRFTTDDNGKFRVSGVVPGEYYFSEVYAPEGYEINSEPVKAVFTEDDAGIEIKDTNRRAYGSITVIVEDMDGNSIEATEIGIYLDPGCTDPAGTYVTDETGRIKAEKLPWGKYYIKEIKPTRGYEKSEEIKEILIGKDGVIDAEHIIIKEQKKGKVLITKTDESGELLLEGAQFSLHKSDGTLVEQELETDSKGQLLIDGLRWGSYYLVETKAPDGYSLRYDPVRFSVNATTGGRTQALEVANEAKMSNIIIGKRLLAEDIHFEHGTPTFTFRLKGTTVDGEEKEYTRQVTFTKKFVNENTDENGYVTNSVIFSGLKAGKYTCTEKDTLRYELEEISQISSNCIIMGDAAEAVFTLEGSDSGQAVFTNRKIDWNDYSDSVSINNIIKTEKKLTAVAAEYVGPDVLEGNMPFDGKKYLEVTAYYDDGSECALSGDEYSLQNGDGSAFERTEPYAGEYTVTVIYSEGNIFRSDTFQFGVRGAEAKTVKFQTNGGTAVEPVSIWKYDTLLDASGTTETTRSGYRFTGWYIDKELMQPFAATEPIIEDMLLYAGWEQLHLNDYSWGEIKEIAYSDNARQLLGECFETIQADLADDGMISADNFKHTKAFDCQGSVIHAMIAGFCHDKKADGETAGLTFLAYEPLKAEAMITSETGRNLGWETSYMRNIVLPEIYENLAGTMKAVICPVIKNDTAKKDEETVATSTEDTLWLPSQTELYGAWGFDSWNPQVFSAQYDNADFRTLRSVSGAGQQYELFDGFVPDGVQNKEAILAAGAAYWTRSVDPSMDRGFCFVDAFGGAASR